MIAITTQYASVKNTTAPNAPYHSAAITAAIGVTINSARQYQNRNFSRCRANGTGGSNTSTARIAA